MTLKYIKKSYNSTNTENISKNKEINRICHNIFMPYIIYLSTLMNDDDIYNNIINNTSNNNLNDINLDFLIEIINKRKLLNN